MGNVMVGVFGVLVGCIGLGCYRISSAWSLLLGASQQKRVPFHLP